MIAALLILKVADRTDGRRVQLRLTKDGERKIAHLASLQLPVNGVFFASFSAKWFDQFYGISAKLVLRAAPVWLKRGTRRRAMP
jgi:DNA-binding MarR family transcriptional regulator